MLLNSTQYFLYNREVLLFQEQWTKELEIQTFNSIISLVFFSKIGIPWVRCLCLRKPRKNVFDRTKFWQRNTVSLRSHGKMGRMINIWFLLFVCYFSAQCLTSFVRHRLQTMHKLMNCVPTFLKNSILVKATHCKLHLHKVDPFVS